MAYLASTFSGSIVKGAKREVSATVRMDAPKN